MTSDCLVWFWGGQNIMIYLNKTFTVVADILVKILPSSDREKQAFTYYRNGMAAQSEGEYSSALKNYYQSLRLEVDAYDRSYILYNIGLLHTNNGEHDRALEYYHQALERNPALPQALVWVGRGYICKNGT